MESQIKLTKEKLGEYVTQLELGEIELDELTAGLIAVHGAIRVEMTPRKFFEYVLSFGIPFDQIDMPDELRKEFEAMRNSN